MDDRYTLEFERAIYNFRLAGNDAFYGAVANALVNGIEHGMEVLVPVEPTEPGLKLLDPSKDNPSEPSIDETNSTVSILIETSDRDHFIVPAFTSEEELDAGDQHYMDVIRCRVSTLIYSARHWLGCIGIEFNKYNMVFNLFPDLYEPMLNKLASPMFEVIRASVLNMHVGAIVNAADSTLSGGGGLDGAIHRLAGPGLKKECRSYGGCGIGDAVITNSYRIDYVDAIIHTVGPVYSGRPEDRVSLANCYLSCLEAAAANGIFSIAFPCISTGANGFPLEEAAKVSIMALCEWFENHRNIPMNVYLCCFRKEEYQAYMKVMEMQ